MEYDNKKGEFMAYFIGTLIPPLVIAFLIVRFALKKNYQKKHGKEMPTAGVILRTIVIGFGLFCVTILSSFY